MPESTAPISAPSQPLLVEEPDNITVIDDSNTSTESKVFELSILLAQFKVEKKESNKTYNAEIKRVQSEIDDLLKQADTTQDTTQDASVPPA
jgi:hypothetical protein